MTLRVQLYSSPDLAIALNELGVQREGGQAVLIKNDVVITAYRDGNVHLCIDDFRLGCQSQHADEGKYNCKIQTPFHNASSCGGECAPFSASAQCTANDLRRIFGSPPITDV